MKIRTIAMALAVAGTPALLAAQQGTPPPQGQPHAEHARGMRGKGHPRGGVEALIARRQELNLTDAQVQRLTAIQQRVESQNRVLGERLRAQRQASGLPDFRPQPGQRAIPGQSQDPEAMRARRGQRPQLTDAQREQLRRFHEQAKPTMDEMRTNMQSAMREVQGVLTEQQRTQIQQWHREHGGRRGRRGDFRGHRGRGEQTPPPAPAPPAS